MNFLKDRMFMYSSILLVFLVPLVYFGNRIVPYISSHTFFFYGYASILFSWWIYMAIVNSSYRLTKKQLVLFTPLFLYLIWMTIAGVLAVNTHLSFFSSFARGTGLLTLYYSTACALIVASLVKRNGSEFIKTFLKWVLASGFIVAISVWLGNEGLNIQESFFMNSSGGGLLGNSSLAAAYLIFTLFSGLFVVYSNDASKRYKAFALFVMGFILLSPLFFDLHGLIARGTVLGSARGALLGVIVGGGISIVSWMILSKQKFLKVAGSIFLLISLVLFVIGWVKLVTPGTFLHQKFTEVASPSRFLFWDVAQRSIDVHPWFGYGPENYMIAFQENFDSRILTQEYNNEAWNDRAHNIYFDTGVSGGYPAIGFYILTFIFVGFAIYRNYKEGRISQSQAGAFYGLFGAYLFQNLFVFDSTTSILYLFLYMGIVYGYVDYVSVTTKIDKKNKDRIGQNMHITIGVIVILLCAVTWFNFALLPARKATLFKEIVDQPINERYTHYKELLDGSTVGNDWEVSEFADTTYKLYAREPLKIKSDTTKIAFVQKDVSAFTEYLEEVALNNKTDYRLYISLVRLHSLSIYLGNKSYDKVLADHMLELLTHAHTLSPSNPEVYWSVAQVYAWSNDIENIKKAYDDAIILDRKLPQSYRLLIGLSQAIGDKDLYTKTLIEAQKNIPNFNLN